jgi:hypothetical protein
MDGTRALALTLHRGDRVESFAIHAERALLGSGSHCDVRVRPDEGAVEQLAFERRGDAVIACARAALPVCSVKGVPFTELRLESDSVIDIGELAIRIALVDVSLAGKKTERSALLPPWLQAVALVLLGLAFYYVLQEDEAPSALESAVRLPELFAEAGVGCSVSEPTAARSLAQQVERAADIKRERSPFHAGEGVRAVPLYRQAAACWGAAGDGEAASAALASANALAARLRDELRVRQVRLERFLAVRNYDAARSEIHVLKELTRERTCPYAQWLVAAEREIRTRAGSQERGGRT